jgi:hypothetical protein
MREIDPDRTPGAVIAAVAGGTVVVPFLIVYAFLFIARGTFVHVEQPDITSSRTGEAIAGVVALVFLFWILIGIGRLLNGRDRWVFAVGQLICAAVAIDFLRDGSTGEPQVPLLVLLGSVAAIVFAQLPVSRAWVVTDGGREPVKDRPDKSAQERRTKAAVDETPGDQG